MFILLAVTFCLSAITVSLSAVKLIPPAVKVGLLPAVIALRLHSNNS